MSKLKKQLIRFLFAGFSAVLVDLVSYYILLNFFNFNLAKTISFIFGSIVAFIVNKYWTFEQYIKNLSEIIRFTSLYSLTLALNIIANRISLVLTDMVLLSFIIATTASTIVNFIGQKFWVFNR